MLFFIVQLFHMKSHKLFLLLTACFAVTISFSQSLSWYKCFAGTIDKYPVVMHLHKAGNSYEGVYYYTSNQQPISFTGNDTAIAGKVLLTANTQSEDYETFTFSIEGGQAKGEWKHNSKSDALNFTAAELKDSTLISFTYVFTEGESKLKSTLEGSPRASYSAASVWPLQNNAKAGFVKQVIRKEFDKKATPGDIGSLLLKQKRNFFASYKKDYAGEDEKELKERPFSFNMDAIKSVTVLYQTPKILSLAHAEYSYTGGAHGNHGTSYVNLNLTAQKRLVLNSILSQNSKPAVSRLLAKYYRQQRGLDASASLKENGLFEDKIDVTDNFYVTGKGIGFVYPPYEIAPYAMGEISIFIPFTELDKYMLPSFKKLIQ